MYSARTTSAQAPFPPNGWTDEAWQAIAGRFAQVEFPADTRLIDQDLCGTSVWVILNGWVKLVVSGPSDRRAILGLRGSGALLGAASAIMSIPTPAAAYCVSPTTAVQISTKAFASLLETQPAVALVVQRSLSTELSTVLRDWAALSTLDATGRVSHVLRHSLSANSGLSRLKVPLRQFEIAQAAMTSVQHLHRVVRKLETAGAVVRRKGWISLT
jgi:CRP/FNR family cyclic AMP-dependent transcriptional regulator